MVGKAFLSFLGVLKGEFDCLASFLFSGEAVLGRARGPTESRYISEIRRCLNTITNFDI